MQSLKDFGAIEKRIKVSAIRAYNFVGRVLVLSVIFNFMTLFFVSQPPETSSNTVAWLTLFNVRTVSAQTLKQTLEQIDFEAQKAEAKLEAPRESKAKTN